MRPFFWLHIKKCAGQSMRAALQPHYVTTDRRRATPFVALPKAEWNDNLNNYRVPLGEYDYRRMLFAKRFLYDRETFDAMYKFAIVRNPYDRAVSCWRYVTRFDIRRPRTTAMRLRFTYFLQKLPECWAHRWDRHMACHTAPIWPDITGEDGALLVDFVARLETIEADLAEICAAIGLEPRPFPKKNVNRPPGRYRKHYGRKARDLVDRLYAEDIANLGYSF